MLYTIKLLLYELLILTAELLTLTSTSHVQLTPATLYPAGDTVTGLGCDTLPAADIAECAVLCYAASTCVMLGYDPLQGLCYLYRYGAPPGATQVNDTGVEYYLFQTREFPQDCQGVLAAGSSTSGTYPVLVAGTRLAVVYCEQDTAGGGWTVFQRREDGTQDFSLAWAAYRAGFGDPRAEHWAGNELLHLLAPPPSGALTNQLYVELLSWSGAVSFAEYADFGVGAEVDNYRLHAGLQYVAASTAVDALTLSHTGTPFSTVDADHDGSFFYNCAQKYGGGWWFANCLDANLNGVYIGTGYAEGLAWYNRTYSYKATKMMVRRN